MSVPLKTNLRCRLKNSDHFVSIARCQQMTRVFTISFKRPVENFYSMALGWVEVILQVFFSCQTRLTNWYFGHFLLNWSDMSTTEPIDKESCDRNLCRLMASLSHSELVLKPGYQCANPNILSISFTRQLLDSTRMTNGICVVRIVCRGMHDGLDRYFNDCSHVIVIRNTIGAVITLCNISHYDIQYYNNRGRIWIIVWTKLRLILTVLCKYCGENGRRTVL